MGAQRADRHAGERARFVPAGGDLVAPDHRRGRLDRFDHEAPHLTGLDGHRAV